MVDYLNETDALHQEFRHTRNGGEVCIPTVGKVDGFRTDRTSGEKWIYEFQVSIIIFLCFVILNILISYMLFYFPGLLLAWA